MLRGGTRKATGLEEPILERMTLELAPLRTARLELVPVSVDRARSVLSGDLSGVVAGEGWPHEGTQAALTIVVRHGVALSWLVVLDDTVIGDCGTHGLPDRAGAVEIGYGLAAPYRAKGYAREFVPIFVAYLRAQPDVTLLRARVEPSNVASRRVLERAGFDYVATADGYDCYETEA